MKKEDFGGFLNSIIKRFKNKYLFLYDNFDFLSLAKEVLAISLSFNKWAGQVELCVANLHSVRTELLPHL